MTLVGDYAIMASTLPLIRLSSMNHTHVTLHGVLQSQQDRQLPPNVAAAPKEQPASHGPHLCDLEWLQHHQVGSGANPSGGTGANLSGGIERPGLPALGCLACRPTRLGRTDQPHLLCWR